MIINFSELENIQSIIGMDTDFDITLGDSGVLFTMEHDGKRIGHLIRYFQIQNTKADILAETVLFMYEKLKEEM